MKSNSTSIESNETSKSVSLKPDASKEVLSMHQASKMTGYHQDYLGQLARSGKLEAHKVGRNWFTTKYAIDKFLGRIKEEEMANQKVESPIVVASSEAAESEVLPTVIPDIKEEIPILKVQEPVLQSEVVEPRIFSKQKIAIKVLRTSHEAGPNLQEIISQPREEKIIAAKIPNDENKNVFLRLNKIFGETELTASRKEPASNKLFSKPAKQSSNSFLKYSLAGAFVVAITIWSTVLLTPPQVQEPLVVNSSPEKRVAGESTSTTENLLSKGKILKNKSEVKLTEDRIGPNSKIFLSFKGDYQGRYWVANQSEGSFVLKLSEPAKQDLEFDYWVVNDGGGESPGLRE